MTERPGAGLRLSSSVTELPPDTDFTEAVHRLLAVVRTQLGMEVAWLSEFVGGRQVLRFVDAAPGSAAPPEGLELPLGGSYCARVVDGRFPALIPDARQAPEAALLDITAELRIGAYVGVPLRGPHGAVTGMLCAVSSRAAPALEDRDVAALRLLAEVLEDLQRRALSAAEVERRQEQLRFVLRSVIEGRGRHPVLQPIVDVTTGNAVAAEGLTRFTLPSPAGTEPHPAVRAPAQWFDDADRLGLRTELELAAAAAVLDLLDTTVPPDVAVSVNVSPETVRSPALPELLHGRDLPRVVLEITEHAPVNDYGSLDEALQPLRADGLRVAVDDAGAGYASLRHVLDLRPDIVKVDMALTRGLQHDLARRTLLRALVGFADSLECRLVAEGIESHEELRAVAACGVSLAQGFLVGAPERQPEWSDLPSA